jgi:DNA (cytosine-5)-methyltransferase 1
LKYLSVCSGIEAATVAWHPLGWTPVGFAEIEKFPAAVLATHYPDVPNFGDMTKFKEWPDVRPDVLVGGTPCQSFSVAGLRKGMADPRGNLALTYLAIADQYRPEWLLWENVPGVLSSWSGDEPPDDLEEGREWESTETSSFGCFLAGLQELGYGFAYRVLDAQYIRVDGFGRAVPQRRRRVFVVGNSRDWRRAAAVLFERDSMSGNPAPSREAGKGTSADVAPSIVSSGRGTERAGDTRGQDPVIATLRGISDYGDGLPSLRAEGGDCGGGSESLVAHSLRGEGFDAREDGTGRGTPIVPVAIAFDCKASGQSGFGVGDVASTMRAMGHANTHQNGGGHQAVAYDLRGREDGAQFEGPHDTANIRAASGGSSRSYVAETWAVRRLTPTECERLQGFPDGYTNVPWRGRNGAPDGPRYKALGNSMAVNAMRWIGTRIEKTAELSVAVTPQDGAA